MNKLPLLALAALTLGGALHAADATLTVRGQAEIQLPADLLTLSIGVVTEGKKAEDAVKENREKMEALIAALQKAGLQKGEVQTGYYAIEPTYTPVPKEPPPDWRATINGYRVTNSLQVQTDKITKAGELIDSANSAGANAINDLRFTLKEPAARKGEAIAAATKQAIADAQAAAAAAGVALSKIERIVIGPNESPQPRNGIMMLKQAVTPIEEGNVSLSATVEIVYRLDATPTPPQGTDKRSE